MAEPKILVTGAAGFIGSHLVKLLLDRGAEIHATTRPQSDISRIAHLLQQPNLTLHRVDLSDSIGTEDVIRGTAFDACIHLAWSPSHPATSLAFSRSLVQTLGRHDCQRIALAGTCFEYLLNDSSPRTETDPTGPVNPTDQAKLQLEKDAATLLAGSPTSLVSARIFYVFGPGENRQRLVSSVISELLAGQPAVLGTGQQRKDYLHVHDVAEALIALSLGDVSGVVNIGSGQGYQVGEIATRIGELLDCAGRVQLGALPPRNYDPEFVVANNHKLLTHTQWQPRFDLESGLRDTVAWWQRQPIESHAP